MTTTDPDTTFQLVTFDLYKDIHKGIRAELFDVVLTAGRLDPSDRSQRLALAEHVGGVVELLVAHAEHEDGAIQPVLEAHLPELAERVEVDHLHLEARLHDLEQRADDAVAAGSYGRTQACHGLYLELASFTSAYLVHQDVEERVIMPKLEATIGVPEVVRIHEAIIGSVPPEVMGASLAIMLPAMNVDDRAGLLGGMRAGAPAEVFEGVWALAGSVLAPKDHEAVARRLDLA